MSAPASTIDRASARGPLMAIAYMTLASLFFALMTLAARKCSRDVPWTIVAGSRGLVAYMVAVAVARARGADLRLSSPTPSARAFTWGRSILGTLSMMVSFYLFARPEIPLGDLAAIGALAPVFIAIAAPRFLGEPSPPAVLWATALGFAGVVVLVQPNFHIAGHLAIFAVLGTAISAGAMMCLRRVSKDEAPEAVAAHFAAVSATACFLASLAHPTIPDPGSIGWLALTGLLGGLGQITMTHAYSLDQAARVGAVGYVGTVLTIALAAALLGEPTSSAQLLGATMVIGAGVLLAWFGSRPRATR